ncbi:glycoside hydrolase superfamily [Spinellus fusiger]|nr:glycoside hydrolase superfamily [Spinellus fusiger]
MNVDIEAPSIKPIIEKEKSKREYSPCMFYSCTTICKAFGIAIISLVCICGIFWAVLSSNIQKSHTTGHSYEPIPGSINTTQTLFGSLDPRLARSFWGVDYTPHGSQLQYNCGVNQGEVLQDLRLLYQITPRIRLYGMDCQQADYVLSGLRLLNIDMGVVLTLWMDNNQTTYERQYHALWDVVKKHGGDNIIGISVGNEALFRKEITVEKLTTAIKDVKKKISELGYPHIPVYTSDIRDLPALLNDEDALLDNVHPFFAGTLPEDAAEWTWKYFYETKPAIISEIGWPTSPPESSVQAAVPSVKNLQMLLDTFVCEANQRGVPYYWFEFKDQPWKEVAFNESREAFWGIFDMNNKLKALTLPNCTIPVWTKGDLSVPQPKLLAG